MDRRGGATRVVAGVGGHRDALLARALAAGAGLAVWVDPGCVWLEAYAVPRRGRYTIRAVTWAGAPPLALRATAARSGLSRPRLRGRRRPRARARTPPRRR